MVDTAENIAVKVITVYAHLQPVGGVLCTINES